MNTCAYPGCYTRIAHVPGGDPPEKYCDVRCGEFRCGYTETGKGKPCDLLTEYLKDQLGAD